jgi:hypothetical protein
MDESVESEKTTEVRGGMDVSACHEGPRGRARGEGGDHVRLWLACRGGSIQSVTICGSLKTPFPFIFQCI